MVIIYFFEYTLSGWIYVIYAILMFIFGFAFIGIVGDKVSKKRQAELKIKREELAKEEFKKAQQSVEKQAMSSGIDMTLDPEANKNNKPTNVTIAPPVVEESKTEEAQQPIVLDAPVQNTDNQPVDNVTPIVDNTNEESVKTEVPAVLVINDDGSSNASSQPTN